MVTTSAAIERVPRQRVREAPDVVADRVEHLAEDVDAHDEALLVDRDEQADDRVGARYFVDERRARHRVGLDRLLRRLETQPEAQLVVAQPEAIVNGVLRDAHERDRIPGSIMKPGMEW